MTEEQEKYILKNYQEGKSISALSKELQESYRHIQKFLVQSGVAIRGGRHKKTFSEEQLQELKDLYYNGVLVKDLSIKYNIDKETLRNIIQENNFQRRNHNRVNKNIKSDYFSKIDTGTKAYYLGLLFTDGSVGESKNGSKRIRISLQAQDRKVLDKLKDELCLSTELYLDQRGNQCYSLEFVDEQIFNDLAAYNIIPQKTYQVHKLAYENIPEEF